MGQLSSRPHRLHESQGWLLLAVILFMIVLLLAWSAHPHFVTPPHGIPSGVQ